MCKPKCKKQQRIDELQAEVEQLKTTLAFYHQNYALAYDALKQVRCAVLGEVLPEPLDIGRAQMERTDLQTRLEQIAQLTEEFRVAIPF